MKKPRAHSSDPAGATQADNGQATQDQALQDALRAILQPLAELALAQGLPYSVVEELTRQAFIDAARKPLLEAGLPEHRLVSRISTATGINRREVTRLTTEPQRASAGTPEPISLASEVFAAWLGSRRLRLPNGMPKPLKRQGPAPSFEAVTRAVTQDVHPRSVLDELCRLGLARLDADTDTVHLLRTTFVPGGDHPQMLRFLGNNVGDHLQAAVHNVTQRERREHFDQAVFCDELSQASLDKLQAFANKQWQRILQEAMPLLEACHEDDKRANANKTLPARGNTRRVRMGFYSYDTGTGAAQSAPDADAAKPKKQTGTKPSKRAKP